MEVSKSRGLIITLVVINIIFLIIISYFVYDKYLSNNQNNPDGLEPIKDDTNITESALLELGCEAFEVYIINHMADWRVNDYKIDSCTYTDDNTLKIMETTNTEKKFYLSVGYDLKPINLDTYQAVGNGKIKDNWHINNGRLITIEKINDLYAVTDTATGP